MKKRWASILLVLVAGLYACAREAPSDLREGVGVMRHMTSPYFLSKSMFYAAYPDGKPSDFVSYMFSEIAAAEWPPRKGGMEDSQMMREQMAATRTPMVPATVMYVPYRPDLSQAWKQVVIKPDDAAGVVIVEGYILPSEDPVIVEKRPLPKVSPDPLAQAAYESAVEMGASARMRRRR